MYDFKQKVARSYVTHHALALLLPGSPDSRYSRIKRMVKQGTLIHIRRGLYCFSERPTPHPFELAQFIYGPSYISLESALNYHQLIPEAVYTITSVTSKRANEFTTPLGVYSFAHVPLPDLYTEVELIKTDEHQFFMAKPWKAICDYIYCYKKNWRSLEPLAEDLRINIENLPSLQEEQIDSLSCFYQQKRIIRFLNAVYKELLINKV